MRRVAGRLCMVLGIVMVTSAGFLFAYNKYEASQADLSAQVALARIQALIDDNKSTSPQLVGSEALPLVSVDIDGYGYIGYLAISSLDLKLPVMDRWDYTRLRLAPCRQCGDTTDNLVIAGHNYKHHFGSLKSIEVGALVQFIDMSGNVRNYEVETVETIGFGDADKVKDSEWNLVLYTCTYTGRNRIMVGCKKIPAPLSFSLA